MKTNELRNSLGILDYYLIDDYTDTEMAVTVNALIALTISKERPYEVSFYKGFGNSPDARNVYRMVTEYAVTPLEEREEEKKYIYKFPYKVNGDFINGEFYLLKEEEGTIQLDDSTVGHVKGDKYFHFTDKQVEAYPEDIQALFKACKKELVE